MRRLSSTSSVLSTPITATKRSVLLQEIVEEEEEIRKEERGTYEQTKCRI